MDCFFHHAVPSIAPCRACRKPICASCRSDQGDCPSCRMADKIEQARRATMIDGGIGPSSGSYRQQQPPPPRVQPAAAVAEVRPETRALVALSYPFWPLALIALLDAKGSLYVRRQAWQALGFNFGMWGFSALLSAIAVIPLLGFSAWPLLGLMAPLWLVASVVYGVKVWHGEDVHVPVVGDWVDARLPAVSP